MNEEQKNQMLTLYQQYFNQFNFDSTVRCESNPKCGFCFGQWLIDKNEQSATMLAYRLTQLGLGVLQETIKQKPEIMEGIVNQSLEHPMVIPNPPQGVPVPKPFNFGQ